MAFSALKRGANAGLDGMSKARSIFRRHKHEAIFSQANIAASRKLNKFIEVNPPFQGVGGRIADAVDPIIKELSKEKRIETKLKSKDIPLFVPPVPHFLPVARMVRDSETWREILVYDDEKHGNIKPRLSWYHPEDTIIPRGWFKDGLVADWNYYFGYLGLAVNFGENPSASTPVIDQKRTPPPSKPTVEERLTIPSRELLELSTIHSLDALAFDNPLPCSNESVGKNLPSPVKSRAAAASSTV